TVATDRFRGTVALSIAIAIAAKGGDDLLAGMLQLPEGQASTTAGGAAGTQWAAWIPSAAQNPPLLSALSFLLGILAGHFFRTGRLIPATMTAAGAVGVCALLIGTALGQGGLEAAAVNASPGNVVLSDAPRRLP